MKSILTSSIAISSLLLLAGCAHYKAKPLPRLATHQSTNKVTLTYKVFDKAECKTFLGRKNILRKGYQPIQLTIANNTSRTYTYSAASLSLPTVPAELVAKKVHFSVASRTIGYGAIAAIIFVPVTIVSIIIGPIYIFIPGIVALCAGAYASPFATTAITDGVKSHKANKLLDSDFAAKTVQSDGIIKPHQTFTGIVFVPKKSFSNDFTFTLNDEKNGQALVLKSATSDKVDTK